MTRVARTVATPLVLSFAPTSAFAAQAALDAPTHCALSQLVLVGRVAGIDTVWAAAPASGLERRVQIVVERVWKGPSTRWVEVVLPGGVDGHWTHRVEDVPDLASSERWGLFLTVTPRGLEVVGGTAGATAIAQPADWSAGVPLAAFAARAEVCRGR